VNSLPSYTQNSRKFGGISILGLQSVGQIKDVFGQNGVQTLINNIGNQVTLRCADPQSAEEMSRAIGDREFQLTLESSTQSEHNSTSTSYQHKSERIVMPSTLQNLAPCVGVLNMAGTYSACWITLPFPPKVAAKTACFVGKELVAITDKRKEEVHKEEKQEIGREVVDEAKDEIVEEAEKSAIESVISNLTFH
jgi:hypothetical protein